LAKDEDDGGVVEKMWEPLIQHSHWPQGSSTLATMDLRSSGPDDLLIFCEILNITNFFSYSHITRSMGNSHSSFFSERSLAFSRLCASIKDLCQTACIPRDQGDWLWLPLRIFVVGGFLLIGLPLAVVAGCLLTLSGFGTFWGKKYCGRRETRPGHTISENDTEARTRGDEGSA